MPGHNSQRQGTARALLKLIVLFCILCVNVYCTVLLPQSVNPIAVIKCIYLHVLPTHGKMQHALFNCHIQFHVSTFLAPNNWCHDLQNDLHIHFIRTFFFVCVTKFTRYYIRSHRAHTQENLS